MDKKYIPILVVAIIVVGAVAYLSTNKKPVSVPNSNSTSKSSSNNNSDPTKPPIPSPVVHHIDISGFAFSPASITVRKGETIVWTNKDSAPHTVTGGTNGDINSLSLAQNQTYSFAFDKTGTFSYHCKLHPNMKGTITVVD